MIEDSILFKIFIRFLKEKNIFNIYKKIVNKEYFIDINKKKKLYFSNNFTIQIFNPKKKPIFNNKEHYIEEFLRDIENNIEFNYILFNSFKKYSKTFLEKNNILEKFSLYIIKYKRDCPIKLTDENLNNIKSHTNEILNWYLNKLMNDKQSIFSFISCAFYWSDTLEGCNFWNFIHTIYSEYMWNNMLQEFKKDN